MKFRWTILLTLVIVLLMSVLGNASEESRLVVVQDGEPPTLDWQFHDSSYGGNIYRCIFDALVAYDRDMSIIPQLAESWETSEDGRVWTFKLRKNITFHNGEPFNADAVVFTIERAMDPEMKEAGIFDLFPERVGLEKIEAVDEYTVVFTTEEPICTFLVWLTFVNILPPEYYSTHSLEELAVAPVGCGPWMFEEWKKDESLTLKAFDHYWQGKPDVETLVWKPVKDPFTRLAMLQTGEADIIRRLNNEDIPIVESDPNLRVGVAPGGFRVHIGIPFEVPAYQDKRVRQAFNYAVNWDLINKAVLGGLSKGRMLSPVIGKEWKSPNIEPYTYDPEKAKSLLKEADFPMDRKITFYTSTNSYMKDKEISEAVAANLRQIGLDVTIEAYEEEVFYPMYQRDELDDLYFFGLGSRLNGPEDISIMSKDEFFEKTNWSTINPRGDEFEEKLAILKKTVDPVRQKELVYELQELVYDEAPWIFLWQQVEVYGISKRTNWEPSGNYMIRLWITGEPSISVN